MSTQRAWNRPSRAQRPLSTAQIPLPKRHRIRNLTYFFKSEVLTAADAEPLHAHGDSCVLSGVSYKIRAKQFVKANEWLLGALRFMCDHGNRVQVAFANVPTSQDAILSVYPPVGILSMAASLKQRGFLADFIDADLLQLSPDGFAQLVARNLPRLIGFTLTVGQVANMPVYISAVQRILPNTPIVLGGPYVTGVGKDIFRDFPTADYAIVHEGDYAIVDLVEYLEGKKGLENVRNLLYRHDGVIRGNKVERIRDLDALPMPDYSLVSNTLDKYAAPYPSIASPSMLVMCTRGCPYECTFCSSPRSWDRKVTFRSTDSVIEEIEYLKNAFGVREIFFQDDTLNARPAWFVDLCEKIMAHGLHKDIYYKCPFRVNERLLTRELLDKARQANFWMIFYGVESGNEGMLHAMKKNVRLDEVRRAFQLTKAAGILSFASFMVGNRGETRKTMQDSLRLLDDINPDFGSFAVAVPFPGSELYDSAANAGHIMQTDFKKYHFGDCIIRTDTLSSEDIVILAKEANAHFEALRLASSAQQRIDVAGLAATVRVLRCATQMQVSSRTTVDVSLANNSREQLSSMPPYPVFVAYHWKRNGACEIYDGLRSAIQVPLKPGEQRIIRMNVATPEFTGLYHLEITLVQEHCFWFEQHLPNFPVIQPVEIVP